MKNRLILILLITVAPFICMAQDLDKVRTEVQPIFNKIIDAIGNFSLAEPRLEITTSKKYVAKYASGENVLYFEIEAYKLCKKVDEKNYKNAIAFILAHELAHRYKEHGWVKKFGSTYADIDVWNEIAKGGTSLEQIKRDETQADLFAGFYCQISGYNSLPLVPSLLDLIYTDYNIPKDKSDRYPSLAERKEISGKTLNDLERLYSVFTAANMALIIGDEDIAISGFEEILNNNFSSREIFNNMGIAYAQKALKFFDKEELGFIYPFEFDAESRLQSGTRAIEEDNEQRRTDLLKKALSNFKKSISLDEKYAPAYINTACVSEILGEIDEAEYHLKKYKKLNPEDTVIRLNALLLEGIMEARKGNKANAIQVFENGICKGNYVAALNLKILKGEDIDQEENSGNESLNISYDGINLNKLLVEGLSNYDETKIENVVIQRKELNNSTLYLIKYKNRRQHLIQVSKEDEIIPFTAAIGINDGYFKVTDQFGTPEKVIASSKDSYYCYDSGKLIFKISNEHKIKGWILAFSIK